MNVVILGSGRGSNAAAILKAQKEGRLGRAQVRAIFADQPEAGILKLGDGQIETRYLPATTFKTKLSPQEEQTYIEAVAKHAPQLVVLAGFMRVLKEPFLRAFDGKIINLHPSLLPNFAGLHAIEQAFRHGVKITGCTVHWVNAELDGGRIIDQKAVRIEDDDTLETLESKVHAAEHALLPSVIARLSEKMTDSLS